MRLLDEGLMQKHRASIQEPRRDDSANKSSAGALSTSHAHSAIPSAPARSGTQLAGGALVEDLLFGGGAILAPFTIMIGDVFHRRHQFSGVSIECAHRRIERIAQGTGDSITAPGRPLRFEWLAMVRAFAQ